MAHHEEQTKVTKDGRTIVKCVDTTEYEEITIKYPLGFERKKRVKVNVDKDGNVTADTQEAKKPWSKKKKLGVGLGTILAAAIGGRVLANALDKRNDEDEEEDLDDSYDEEDVDDDEDVYDDSDD